MGEVFRDDVTASQLGPATLSRGLAVPDILLKMGFILLLLHLLDLLPPAWSPLVSSIHNENCGGRLNLLLAPGMLLVCLGDTPQCSCTCSIP